MSYRLAALWLTAMFFAVPTGLILAFRTRDLHWLYLSAGAATFLILWWKQ